MTRSREGDRRGRARQAKQDRQAGTDTPGRQADSAKRHTDEQTRRTGQERTSFLTPSQPKTGQERTDRQRPTNKRHTPCFARHADLVIKVLQVLQCIFDLPTDRPRDFLPQRQDHLPLQHTHHQHRLPTTTHSQGFRSTTRLIISFAHFYRA